MGWGLWWFWGFEFIVKDMELVHCDVLMFYLGVFCSVVVVRRIFVERLCGLDFSFGQVVCSKRHWGLVLYTFL